MYNCYVCGLQAAKSVKLFQVHLYRHRDNGDLVMPIRCRQGNCKSSFNQLYNFMRHINAFHSDVVAGFADECDQSVSGDDDDERGTDQPAECSSMVDLDKCVDSVDFFHEIQSEAVSLVAGLRANSSIPYRIVPQIAQSFNSMANSMMSFVQVEVASSLCDAGVSKDSIDEVKSNLDMRLDSCRQPLDFLSSRYKIDKFFACHPLSVCPVSVPFAARLESHGGQSSFVYDSFQYVSVKKTLQSLLQNKSYVEALLQDRCEPDVLSDFSDGSRCREHVLFGDCSKFSVKIQLFYDGLGVTNPLRGQSSLHNVGVFFYSVKNLPPQFNSCFGNVHLLALCYSHDISVYGYERVLDKFVAEMKELSTVGLQGTFPVLGDCTVYASLLQVTCDNLALNGLLGFIESFSSSYFCTMCYATSDEIQRCFREEMFKRRTPQEYNRDLAGLVAAQKASKVHCRGVKRDCKLNEIAGFHVTENFSLDVMHIVMEGIVPVELGCILSGLCTVDKRVTLDTVNREFRLLWGKVTMEQSHKPAELSNIVEPVIHLFHQ